MASRRGLGLSLIILLALLTILFILNPPSAQALTEPIAPAPDWVGAGGSLVYPGRGDYIYALQGNNTSNFWRYSLSQNKWETRSSLPSPVGPGGSLVWTAAYPDYIFALQGNNTSNFWRYSISNNSWTARSLLAATMPAGWGSALAYPGSGDYIYALVTNYSTCWSKACFLQYSISQNKQVAWGYAPSAGGSGLSLVYPGTGVSIYASDLYAPATGLNYDPVTGTVSPYSFNTEFWRYNVLETLTGGWRGREPPPADMGPGAALGYPGKGEYIYAFRGNYTPDFWRYPYYVLGTGLFTAGDILQAPNPWEARALAPAAVAEGASLAGTGGDYLYAFRGGWSKDFWRYSISKNLWETTISISKKPITTISLNPNRPDTMYGWYTTIPTITLTRDMSGTTYYQWDSMTGPWTTYTGPFPALVGDYNLNSYHTLYYYSVSEGETEAIKFFKLKVDPNYTLPHFPIPHGDYDPLTEFCATCHRSHTGMAPQLLSATGLPADLTPADIEKEVCYVCHDGSGSNYNILAQFGRSPTETLSHHPVPENVLKCSNCHDPHLSPTKNPRFLGDFVSDQYGVKKSITGNDNSLCFACHPAAVANSAYPGPTFYGKTKHATVNSSGLALTRWDERSFDSGMCGNCHNPHGAVDATDLRRKPKNSLCAQCHDDAKAPPKPADYSYQGIINFETAAHASTTNPFTVWPNPFDTGGGIASGGATPGECINCHNPHGKDDGSGNPFDKATMAKEENLCYGGSGGSGACHAATTGSVNNINIYQRFTTIASTVSFLNPIPEFFIGATWKYTARHGIIDEDQIYSGQKTECPSCHNPHLNTASLPVIDPDNKSQPFTGTTKDFCLKCHQNQVDSAEKIDYFHSFHGDKVGNNPDNSTLKPPYTRGMTLPCTDCHDAHGSPNPYHLKEVINGKAVSYFYFSSSADALYPPGWYVNWYNFCGACHVNPLLGEKATIDYAHGKPWACGPCHSTLYPSWQESKYCMPCHAHNPRNIAVDMTRGRAGGL